jgi:argininosuccinate synthase
MGKNVSQADSGGPDTSIIIPWFIVSNQKSES